MLLLASRYPFRQVIGMEYARELAELACENVRRAGHPDQRCRAIAVQHVDATIAPLPPGPLVLYLFNPFTDVVMDVFEAHVEAEVLADDRPVWVVYKNARHARAWEGSSLFRRVAGKAERGAWAVYHHESKDIGASTERKFVDVERSGPSAS